MDCGRGIFVVHGGLMTDYKNTTLDTINKVDRHKYSTVFTQSNRPTASDLIIEEMLWSDPTQDGRNGVFPSERGSGIEFGPDVALHWLQSIGCNNLVRSHECVEDGCEYMPIAEAKVPGTNTKLRYALFTVFSASNYSDGDNQAAVLTFVGLDIKPKVFRFRSSVKPPDSKLTGRNRLRLADMLFRRHYRLLRAFQKEDQANTGILDEAKFVGLLKQVLNLDINFKALLPSLLGDPVRQDGTDVDYKQFLSRFSTRKASSLSHQATLSSMYDKFGLLKSTFELWDEDHNGTVDFEEFSKAVTHINEASGTSLDPTELFELLDLDRSGAIDMNEFCEAFRLSRDAIVEQMPAESL